MASDVTWSYSALQAFETCPRRYFLTKVSKEVKEPQTQATLWGNEVHKALEIAVKSQTPLPERFKQFQPIVTRITASSGTKYAEQKLGLTKDLSPTTFFAKNVWLRLVVDLAIVRQKDAVILDYKTGKPKADGDQLRLFAAAGFSVYPHVERIHASYLWLKDDKMDTATYTRDDVPAIWDEFNGRVLRIAKATEDNRWPPNPSGLCRKWCPVGAARCEFCGE